MGVLHWYSHKFVLYESSGIFCQRFVLLASMRTYRLTVVAKYTCGVILRLYVATRVVSGYLRELHERTSA